MTHSGRDAKGVQPQLDLVAFLFKWTTDRKRSSESLCAHSIVFVCDCNTPYNSDVYFRNTL